MRSIRSRVVARSGWLVVLALLMGGPACVDEDESEVAGDGSYHDDGDIPENQLIGLEAEFAEIAALLPEFAGYYYVGRELIVRVTCMAVADEPRAVILTRPIAMQPVGGRDGPATIPEIRIEPADYSFLELNEWRSRIRRSVMNIDGVVLLDLDEVNNRIVVAVAIGDSAARSAVEDLFDAAAIPREATNIVEREPVGWGSLEPTQRGGPTTLL